MSDSHMKICLVKTYVNLIVITEGSVGPLLCNTEENEFYMCNKTFEIELNCKVCWTKNCKMFTTVSPQN